MTYLLDTNTCIQFLRHGINSTVAVKLAGMGVGEAWLCSIVVGELLFGSLRSKDVAKSIAEVRAFCAGFPSVPFNDSAADAYARIRADLSAKGTPIGPNDLMIAAIALANDLILVTHNSGEFRRVTGLKLEDWQI